MNFFKNLITIFTHYQDMLNEYNDNIYFFKKYQKSFKFHGTSKKILYENRGNVSLGGISILLISKIDDLQHENQLLLEEIKKLKNK